MIRGISPFFLLLLGATAAGAVLAAIGTGADVLIAGIVLLVLGGVGGVAVPARVRARARGLPRRRPLRAGKGYLTLDIRRYTDVGLSFVLPVLFLLLGGIPLPGGAVWIDHGAIRSRGRPQPGVARRPRGEPRPRRWRWSSRSRVVPMPIGLAAALSCLALIQVLAFVLNILPVPGLDGFGVLEPYLSPKAQLLAAKVRPWAPLVLLLVLLGLPGASAVFFEVGRRAVRAVGGDVRLASAGYGELLFWR